MKMVCRYLEVINHSLFVSNCFTDDKKEILDNISAGSSVAICRGYHMSGSGGPSNNCKKRINHYHVNPVCWKQPYRDMYGNKAEDPRGKGQL